MKKYLAEYMGTFALVFWGTGSIIVNEYTDGAVGLVGIALAFGLIIVGMIYTFGPISGTHINPAVTISLMATKKIAFTEGLFYMIAQVIGAISASFALHLMFVDNLSLGATMPSGSLLQSFAMEFIATFFLMLIILGVTSQKKEVNAFSGLVIGLTVTGLIFVAGPISGGSFNPARSIGPALVSGDFSSLWIYLIAPTFGAVLAAFSWELFGEKKTA